jgi:hypothetical protein
MLVLVRGDPSTALTEIIGLDVLARRHPSLYCSILDQLGYSFNTSTNIVCSRQGVVDASCQPDPTGRQISIKPTMYPTDVVNTLTEAGAFEMSSSTCHGGGTIVVWSLAFKYD